MCHDLGLRSSQLDQGDSITCSTHSANNFEWTIKYVLGSCYIATPLKITSPANSIHLKTVQIYEMQARILCPGMELLDI